MVIKYSLIGKRVASRRRQLKLTQAQLAEKTELTSKYISNIETSHSLESLMQLCAALDVTPNYLLFGISEKQETTKLDEVNRLLSTCTPQQLEKVIEFIEFITNRS